MADEIAQLKAQLAAVTAERDAVRTCGTGQPQHGQLRLTRTFVRHLTPIASFFPSNRS